MQFRWNHILYVEDQRELAINPLWLCSFPVTFVIRISGED